MEECKDIMVIDWATRIPTDAEEEYLSHLFCLGGGCWYRFNGMDFELHAGDLSIIRKRKMIENIEGFLCQDYLCEVWICWTM